MPLTSFRSSTDAPSSRAISDFAFPLRTPGEGQRMFVAGTTRSGKTVLMQNLLPHLGPYLVVHDGKGRIAWPGFHLHTSLESCTHDPWPWLIYRPPHEHIGVPDAAEAFYEWNFKRGHVVVYTDEMRTIAHAGRMPLWWHACMTRGGELDVSMVNGTQRPKGIPQEMLSEPEYAILFRLNLSQDRDRVEEICDIDGELLAPKALPKHYWHFVVIGEEPYTDGPFHLSLPATASHATSAVAA